LPGSDVITSILFACPLQALAAGLPRDVNSSEAPKIPFIDCPLEFFPRVVRSFLLAAGSSGGLIGAERAFPIEHFFFLPSPGGRLPLTPVEPCLRRRLRKTKCFLFPREELIGWPRALMSNRYGALRRSLLFPALGSGSVPTPSFGYDCPGVSMCRGVVLIQ